MKFWHLKSKIPKEQCWLLLAANFGNRGKVIAETEGGFGTIYTLDLGKNTRPRYLVAKTPRINPKEEDDEIRHKIVRFLHEINETYRYSNHPLVSRHSDVKICLGAPFVFSRKRDITVEHLIDNGDLSLVEALSITVQIAHALSYCSSRGLTSHQDLKPANIFLDRLASNWTLPANYPLHHRVMVADFGLANAFSVFGHRWGSRPYMAPEQYADSTTLAKADVFALGVILHELLGGGCHPIGERTRDVWPTPLQEKGNKWKHETVWKHWASEPKTIFPDIIPSSELRENIIDCLNSNIAQRHTMISLKDNLLRELKSESEFAFQNLSLLLEHFDKLTVESEAGGWPHFDDLLQQVNAAEWG
jgi:serine/threonine protein kinase